MIKQIIKTYGECVSWLNKSKWLAIDTESTCLDYFDSQLVGISLCNGKQAYYIDLFENEEFADIIGFVNRLFWATPLLIFHNAPYDLKVLYKCGINKSIKNIFCTLTASHLLDENTPNGLKYLASAHLNIPHQNIKEWEDVCNNFHSKEFYDYAIHDVIWTMELYKLFAPKIETQGLHHVFYDIEMPFQFCLRDMEINGCLLDTDKLQELKWLLEDKILDLQIKLCRIAKIDFYWQYLLSPNRSNQKELVYDFNFNSPQQVSQLLKEKFSLNVNSVDKQTLNRHKQHEFVKLLLEYRAAVSFLSKFIDKLPGFIRPDGRIHTSFRNTLITGRLSSSDPPMQQLPKDNTGPVKVRECIVSPPGKNLICCDYSGQELRVLAEESGDMTMIEAFYKNQDLHLTTANKFFNLNIPDEVLIVGHPLHEETKKKYKTERDRAKVINFGISYGKTAYGFSKDWSISQEEAQQFIDKYFEGFPDVKKRIDKCNLDLRNNGYVVNLAGRRRRFPGYNSANNYTRTKMERQAFNFLIQGAAADLCKYNIACICNEIKKHSEIDCKLILTVHDEYIFECRSENINEVINIIKKNESLTPWKSCLPFIIDVKSGNNYSEAKP